MTDQELDSGEDSYDEYDYISRSISKDGENRPLLLLSPRNPISRLSPKNAISQVSPKNPISLLSPSNPIARLSPEEESKEE
jgi:hypothetical protein